MEETQNRTGPTTVWVDAFKVGDLVAHPRYGEQRYTETQLLEAVRNFRDLTAKGYETTLLREHGHEDSYQYGKIHDVRISTDGYFQCAVQFYRLADREAFNEGILREFSPGFAREWLEPHPEKEGEGKIWNNVLLELSFTSRAYQRNLRPPQNTNPGVVLSDNMPTSLAETPSGKAALQGDNPMEEEEVAEEVTEEEEETVAFNMDEFASEVRAFMALMAPPTAEEPATMSDDVTELQTLSAELADVRGQLLTSELSAKGIDADNVKMLVGVRRNVSDEQFNQIVELSARGNTTTVQAEIGETGSAAVSGAETPIADILEAAKGEGVKYGSRAGGGLVSWATKNHPDRVNEIITFARR